MRVLFLTHRLPYAPNRGDRTRAYHILRLLTGHAEVDLVSLVHSDDEAGHAGDLKDLVATVTMLRVGKIWQATHALGALTTRTPLTHALLDAANRRHALNAVVARHRPDVVLAYCSGVARFALEPPLDGTPLVLDMVDVDSEKWRDLSKRSGRLRAWVYAREARYLADFEAIASERATATVVVTEREQEALRRLAPSARIVVAGNGVDCDALRPPGSPAGERRVVFTGVMDYEPNEQAVLWLAREVWPRVLARCPAARLLIVGANPKPAIQDLPAGQPTIEVTGTVPDVREYLWGSAVSVAPLWTARGVQNKVLEAIAAGLPCVVTPVVAEGLPPAVLPACRIESDVTGFSTAIVELLEEGGQARREIAGRAKIHELSWETQLSGLIPLLDEATIRG